MDLAIHSLPIRLVSFKGGKAHNAIPGGEAGIAMRPGAVSAFTGRHRKFEQTAREEICSHGKDACVFHFPKQRPVRLTAGADPAGHPPGFPICPRPPDGVSRMSPEIEGLVVTSNNLATVEIKEISSASFPASEAASHPDLRKSDQNQGHRIACRCRRKIGNAFPPWQPEMTSLC